MSIETNKNDFEKALENLEEYMADMGDSAHPDLIEVTGKITEEYDGHYRHDIEYLMDKVDELKNEAESLKQDIEDLEDKAAGND